VYLKAPVRFHATGAVVTHAARSQGDIRLVQKWLIMSPSGT